jgi:hypothetical protein
VTDAHTTDLQALEALVVNNPDLERLEALLEQFNIFEALGMVRQELRHSDFLGFLCSPSAPHSLGDAVIKLLLQRVLIAARGRPLPISLFDLDVWDFERLQVRREWQNIDILLLDSRHSLAVIIENKVDSGEHSGQLQRYWTLVQDRYPGWKIIGLFLTPSGEAPSDGRYFPLGYATVCAVLEELVQRKSSTLGADVRTLIVHYTQMLRRHIVGDSEIALLCQRLYARHKRAFDLINKQIEARTERRRRLLDQLVRQSTAPAFAIEPGGGGGTYTRFIPADWDREALRAGKGWTQSRRMLLFEFVNAPDSLRLALCLGPGPVERRQPIYELAAAHEPPFRRAHQGLQPKFNWLYWRRFLTSEQIGEYTDAELDQEIRRQWAEFLTNDLPALDTLLHTVAWIWQSGAAPTVPTTEFIADEEVEPSSAA